MVKKIVLFAIAVVMVAALAAGVPVFTVEATDDLTPENNSQVVATAAYAKERPVIDGKIDAVWDTTDTLDTWCQHADVEPEGFEMATGHVKILWTEDALYFLSVVKDPTLACIGEDSYTNMVNLWIAESVTEDETYEADGNYFLLLNSSGNWCTQYSEYGNAAMAVAEEAVQTYDDWYVQEIRMPIMTPGLQYSEGHVIGFEVSVDDDWDGDNVRDSYANWMDAAPYWSNPSVMCGVRLQQTAEHPYRADRYGDEDVPAETTAPEATQEPVATQPEEEKVPEKNTEPDATQEPILTIGADTKNETKSLSTVGIIAIAAAVVVVAAAVVIVAVVKKKNK